MIGPQDRRAARDTEWNPYRTLVPPAIVEVAEQLLDSGRYDVRFDARRVEEWAEVGRLFAADLSARLASDEDTEADRSALDERAAWVVQAFVPYSAALVDYHLARQQLETQWGVTPWRPSGYATQELLNASELPTVALEIGGSLARWLPRGQDDPAALRSRLTVAGAWEHDDEEAFRDLNLPPAFVETVREAMSALRRFHRDRDRAKYQLSQTERWEHFHALPERFRGQEATAPRFAEVFRRRPAQFGLRGDSYLWDELSRILAMTAVPSSGFEASDALRAAIQEAVGESIHAANRTVYVSRFDPGTGMSRGVVSLDWWAQTGIPILVDRCESIIAASVR